MTYIDIFNKNLISNKQLTIVSWQLYNDKQASSHYLNKYMHHSTSIY